MSTGKLTATNQRWVNKLVKFSFSLHFKPGKQKIFAGTLRCTPEQKHLKCIESCRETVMKELLDDSDSTQYNKDGADKFLKT